MLRGLVVALFKRKNEKKIENITLEINGKEVELYPLKFKQSLALAQSAEKKNFFVFVEDFIKEASSLDRREIKRLEIRDAIGLMVYHRFYFWDNLEISTDPVVLPSNFLFEREFKKDKFSFGSVTFTNYATLEAMQKAEKLCIIERNLDYYNIYLLSAFAETPKKGVDAILLADDTAEVRNFVTTLNNSIRNNGDVALNFITDLKALHLVSEDNYTIDIKDTSFFLHYQNMNIFTY